MRVRTPLRRAGIVAWRWGVYLVPLMDQMIFKATRAEEMP